MAQQYPPPDSQGDSLANVLGAMGQTQEMFQRAAQDGATPGIEVTTNMSSEGTTHTIEMGDADLRTILGTIKNYSQVVDAYQQEIGRLQQQQDRIQKNPILNVLATVGGATAMQDKRLPPIVRALGESSRALNPTYNELEDRKLGVLGQEGQALSRIGALQEAGERTKASIAYRQDLLKQADERLAEKKRSDKANEDIKTTARDDARMSTALKYWQNELDRNHGKEVSRKEFEAGMAARGITDKDKVDGAWEAYRGYANTSREAYTEKQKADQERRENSPTGIQQKMDKENAARLANHIVDMFHKGDPRDMDSLRSVTGAFGKFKAQVMSEISKLDPSISEEKIERAIRTENSFSGAGKDAMELQSYGTFVGHAGDLSDDFKQLGVSNSKFLNMGINKIRREAKDSPELQRVIVDIDAVTLEFQKFLNGAGRALYESDKKVARDALDENLPLKTRIAALNQMGKTVGVRYREMATRYRQGTNGADLGATHGFDDLAVTQAKKIGLTLPSESDPAGLLQ